MIDPLRICADHTGASRDARLRARDIFDASLVWDNHACFPLVADEQCLSGLERYLEAGVTCVHINIGDSDVSLERQIRVVAAYRAYIAAHPQRYTFADSVESILTAKSTGRLAVCFDVEGMHAMENQLSLLGLYHTIGVRWMLIAYNRRNLMGGGCHDAEDIGLTALGRRAVAEMDRLGIVKDCSHTGYRTCRDVLEASTLPVNFSHSNPRGLVDHPRNIPDDLIRGCARTGGVVGINGIGLFLGSNDIRTENLVGHINYVADLVGTEHVGLGLDHVIAGGGDALDVSGAPDFWPAGFGYEPGVRMVEPERIPRIAEELLRTGHCGADVKKILGGNFLRVAGQVWR